MKRKLIWIGGAVIVAALFWWFWGELKIDRCLDNGGRWNYEKKACET
jgi:hypothetical protein